jgi:metallo-beta-lactamase family protein
MKLTFCSGAGTVTGANYLLESESGERIIIDCGLLQGSAAMERANFEPFAYDVKGVRAAFITHAHLDHVGRLPKLWCDGFRGPIYSTAATRDLAELSLLDAEHIREKFGNGSKVPFCEGDSVGGVMALWKTADYHATVQEGPFSVRFYDAGHVLGSSFISIDVDGKRIVFSGDLGNTPSPIVKPTETLPECDYLLIESTYGGRVHEDPKTRDEILEDVIEDTAKSRGTLLIPVFALERAQDILWRLNTLFEEKRVPRMPVFVDSPLAIKMTTVYKEYEHLFNKEAEAKVEKGDDIFNFPGLTLCRTSEESKRIAEIPAPKVILAGSGMSQGGRILYHELNYLPDEKSTILFVGYQTGGSLGRSILEGQKEVRILHQDVPVHCKIRSISSYSAHADQPQLMRWVEGVRDRVKKVFVVQGEPDQAQALATKMKDEYTINAVVPESGDTVVL